MVSPRLPSSSRFNNMRSNRSPALPRFPLISGHLRYPLRYPACSESCPARKGSFAPIEPLGDGLLVNHKVGVSSSTWGAKYSDFEVRRLLVDSGMPRTRPKWPILALCALSLAK